MPYKTIIDILVDELAEIRILELQFTNLLPQMILATQDAGLQDAFTVYLDQAAIFFEKFDQTADILRLPSNLDSKCVMRVSLGEKLEPLLKECSHHAVDAALIGMALKVESYLNAAYLNACVHSRMLGLEELGDLLKSRLKSNFAPTTATFDKVALFAPEASGEEEALMKAGMTG